MPTLKRTCRRPWQPEHAPQMGRRHANTEFYRSTAWRKLRAEQMRRQPLCERCLVQGRHTPARIVDHICPVNQGGAPLDLENLQSLCAACHNRKSGTERHQRQIQKSMPMK